MTFASSHNLVNSNQHGFMHGRSTCSQLLKTQYGWCSGMDVGDIFDVIIIDFRTAFDVVPHTRLVSKLADLSVCRQTLLWLAAFLSDKQQLVPLNSRYSAPPSVTSDIIQGSILGPLLFTFYINDLPPECANCIIKLFVDDVKLSRRISCTADRLFFPAALEKLCDWAKLNGMRLSISKCCYLQIGYRNLGIVCRLNFEILTPCDCTVDLGR